MDVLNGSFIKNSIARSASAWPLTASSTLRNAGKGQGGYKSGDNGCAGKNSCKGKGGCKVPVEHL